MIKNAFGFFTIRICLLILRGRFGFDRGPQSLLSVSEGCLRYQHTQFIITGKSNNNLAVAA